MQLASGKSLVSSIRLFLRIAGNKLFATASVPVTFEKPAGRITYHRCQVLQRSPIRMLAANAHL